MNLTVVPAYGRDYKTAKEAKSAFEANSDFLIMDISSPDDGKYASKHDLPAGTEVKIRYNKHQDFTFVKVK